MKKPMIIASILSTLFAAHMAFAQPQPSAAVEPKAPQAKAEEKADTKKADEAKKAEKKETEINFAGFKVKLTDDGKDGIKIKEGKKGEGTEINVNLDEFKQLAEQTNKRPTAWWTQLDDILVPLAFFAFLFAVFYMRHNYKMKNKAAQMEIIKAMIEKNQPIPPNLFTEEEKRGTWQTDMDRGFKLTGIGAGLAIFFFTVEGPWAIGAIVGFMGIGYLVSSYVKKSTNADQKI